MLKLIKRSKEKQSNTGRVFPEEDFIIEVKNIDYLYTHDSWPSEIFQISYWT